MTRKARTESEFVQAGGTIFQIVQKLSNAVDDLGGGDADLRRIISDPSLCRELAELIVGNNAALGTVYPPITIDYTQTVEAMVKAGNYDFANPYITGKNFTVEEGAVNVDTVLMHLDRSASDEEVLAELDRQGLRPATMVELLAFGAQQPDVQRQFPVVALGSVWADRDGGRSVGCLWEGAHERHLYLYWLGSGWPAYDRFLAVRK